MNDEHEIDDAGSGTGAVAVDPAFRRLLEKLYDEHGFDFRQYKEASLLRRVERRMSQLHIDDFDAYVRYLDGHPGEHAELLNVILINVTRFFRDPEAWRVIAEQALPNLVEDAAPQGVLRVWSAGCSSGEEPYTVAMLLAEHMGPAAHELDVKIYATDIDEDALATARHGLYRLDQLKDVPRDLLERYFAAEGQLYRLRREIRKWVIFGRHDLAQDAPLSHLDLLICRNVLIYFDSELQKRILPRFQYAVRERGYLFLGRSESLLARARRFLPIDVKWRIFQRVTPPDLMGKPITADGESALRPSTQGARRESQLAARYQSVIDAHPSALLVVDASDAIVTWNPAAEALFDIPADAAVGRKFRDLDVSYRVDNLRARLEEVKSTEKRARLADVKFARRSGDPVHIALTLSPLYDERRRLSGVLLCADDVSETTAIREELNRLAEQSATANEELQSTNEELETTNEELQSTNEELETTNEELQSTNEELETTVEELQAVNTELGTINTELERRTAELNVLDGMHTTVVDAVRGAIVVLDRKGLVKTWNLGASRIWGLRAQDAVGRPFATLAIGDVTAKTADAIGDAVANRRSTRVEGVTFSLPAGGTQTAAVEVVPLVEPGGDLVGTMLRCDDSTSRRS